MREGPIRYIRVVWVHEFPDEPVELYSELGEQSRELRKVEVFRDGSRGFAEKFEGSSSTQLGIEPFPSLKEIASDAQFRPELITKAEFERAWETAYAISRAKTSIG